MVMLGFMKICIFTIYGISVYIFSHYLTVTHIFNSYNDWLFDNFNNNDVYDFIIVGSGSAGSKIAAELCREKCNVLLVEAGSTPAPFFDVPILTPLLQKSPYDWRYKTVPQNDACKGLSNNQSLWPQGKVLGGSSRLNYMAYVPGHPKDYENWFPDFFDYKLKDDDPTLNEPRWHTLLSEVISKASLEISAKKETDFRKVRLTMKNGERWSTDKLLNNALNHGLRVITNSLVNKLLFDGKKAKGIEFIRWKKKFKAFAKSGIILSAGAIGSPKLLMLSGIGPKEHLESLDIDVINDLPVGKNLMDHILTGIDLITLNISSPLSLKNVLNPMSMLNYTLFRKGPWTSAGIEGQGTFYISSRENEDKAPEIQLMLIPVGISQDGGIFLRKTMGISAEIFEKYFAPLVYQTAITIAPVLLHPKSRGEVKLASIDPYDDPLIDPKYLSHEEDVSTLISGIQLIKSLIKTDAMKKIGASLYETKFPGCESYIFDTMKYWECYIRHLTLTSYHPAGTCGIGRVVDNSFRVLNMKNLYVIDASILPELPSGNIQAAVMMLAERSRKLLIKNDKRKMKYFNASCSKFASYLTALYGYESEIFSLQSQKILHENII